METEEEKPQEIYEFDIEMSFEDLEKKFKSMRGLEPDFEPILNMIIQNNFDSVHSVQLTED